MVERLFNFNPINDGESECTVTDQIKDAYASTASTFNERSSPINRSSGKLPTINENLEGFQTQLSTSCDRSLPLNTGTRIRRHSHPGTLLESKTSVSKFSTGQNELRATGGKTRCLRDPMLSFEITPKEETVVFHKHKLHKIDEDDSLTEERREDNLESRDISNSHTEDILTVLPVRTIVRRSSYPTDSNHVRHFDQHVDLNDCSEKEIVSKWMKFF